MAAANSTIRAARPVTGRQVGVVPRLVLAFSEARPGVTFAAPKASGETDSPRASEPGVGIEPTTSSLQEKCSAN
jgi:hypothetical protein